MSAHSHLRAFTNDIVGNCICGEPGKLEWIMPDDRWAVFCSIQCIPATLREKYQIGFPNRRNAR